MESWRIQLFGSLRAHQGEETLSRFRTQKTGALLGYLALHGGRITPREVLLDVLWPESDLDAARNSLNVALSSLRAQLEAPVTTPGASPLGQVLITDRTTVRLNPAAFSTDVAEFEALLRRARTDQPDIELLSAAVELYSGELLTGLYEDWVLGERDRLAGLFREALRQLVARLMETGQTGIAVEYVHHALRLDPHDEELQQLLEHIRTRVSDLDDTEGLLLVEQGRDKVADTASRVLVSSPTETQTAPGNLPLAFTSFVGRARELQSITAQLSEEKAGLITLTGPAGAGKTRLALEAAGQTATEGVPGGAWFVPLATATSASQIPEAIRDAIRLPRSTKEESLQQIATYFHGRHALLVLDNLEQLLGRGPLDPAGAAAAIRTLRQILPQVTFVLTSREALGVSGEHEFPVPMLGIPAQPGLGPEQLLEFASVRLFVDRARNRRPDFQVTPRNADAVAGLVTRLEGVPLAIELAAAWSGLLAPSQILERLEQRFELLVSRRKGVSERHRSLRAAIEWGYDLLAPDARRLFAALSVFRGGWTTEAAEALCEGDEGFLAPGRTLECLSLLRNASFLVADETDSQELRLSLLEMLREFADEQLTPQERSHLERQHALYFLERARPPANEIFSAEVVARYDHIEAELPNYRVALERLTETELGPPLARALCLFWKIRGYSREGLAWLNRVIAYTNSSENSSPPLERAGLLSDAGILSEELGDYSAANPFYEASAALHREFGNDTSLAQVRENHGNIAYRQGDYSVARCAYTEALEAFQRINDVRGIASTTGNLANIVQDEGDYAEARRLQEECLRLSRSIGELRMAAYTLRNLGNISMIEGNRREARLRYEECLPELRALGDRRAIASLQNAFGYLELQEGRLTEAATLFEEAVIVLQELGSRLHLMASLEGLAWYAGEIGNWEHATRLWAAAAAAHELLSMPHTPQDAREVAERVDSIRTALPPVVFAKAWTEGAQLSLEEAIQLALQHIQK